MSSPIPEASGIESASQAEEVSVDMTSVLSALKSLETAELFKVMKHALTEAERKAKSAAKGATRRVAEDKSGKKGSMPKGVVPKQLKKPRAWVEFVLAHAKENGWEAFTVYQSKKDKATGEKVEEIIEMPASILHEGAHVYEGSITEKTPSGRQLIQKDAMSLSKQYWAPRDKKGSHPELYEEFEASYTEEVETTAETASVTSSKVIRMTAAEKQAATEAKKLAREAAQVAKKAMKDAERAAKKAEREAATAAKKAEKTMKQTGKKGTASKSSVGVATVPVAAIAKPEAVAVSTAVKVTTKKPAVATKMEEWSCPADGMIHPWPYKGKNYFRNADNEVWLKAADGSCGDWQGIYLPAEDRIDDSVAEPEFADEE